MKLWERGSARLPILGGLPLKGFKLYNFPKVGLRGLTYPRFSRPARQDPRTAASGRWRNRWSSAKVAAVILISLGLLAIAYRAIGSIGPRKIIDFGLIEVTKQKVSAIPLPSLRNLRIPAKLPIPGDKIIPPVFAGAATLLFFIGKKVRRRKRVLKTIRRAQGH
jgi:hypothetical protein